MLGGKYFEFYVVTSELPALGEVGREVIRYEAISYDYFVEEFFV